MDSILILRVALRFPFRIATGIATRGAAAARRLQADAITAARDHSLPEHFILGWTRCFFHSTAVTLVLIFAHCLTDFSRVTGGSSKSRDVCARYMMHYQREHMFSIGRAASFRSAAVAL